MKKIYILADMEGVSGIWQRDQVRIAGGADYEEGRVLHLGDMNAAIDAAFAAGADEVVACDTHGGGHQLRVGDMDPRAVYEVPGGGRLMPALDATFAGVVLLGHHAMAGTPTAFLDHTMSSEAWFEYSLNGQPLGEIGIEAAWAGHYGVPVIAVTGDAAAAAEARATLGDVETAAVKWAIVRNRARCLSLPTARAALRGAVERAVRAPARFKPFRPSLPATLRLTFYRTDMAEERLGRPDVRRVDGRTIEKTLDSLLDVMAF